MKLFLKKVLIIFVLFATSFSTVGTYAAVIGPTKSYIKDFIFENKGVMRGIFSNVERYFYVENYWDVKYITVNLEYEISKVAMQHETAMTLYLNDVPFYSFKPTADENGKGFKTVNIPANQTILGYNRLTASSYVKTKEEATCSDAYSDALWMTINEDSYIRIGYEIKNFAPKLKDYPFPYITSAYSTGKTTSIFVTDDFTGEEMASAMYLMADLSNKVESENNLRIKYLSSPLDDNSILICLYDKLPKELHQQLSGYEYNLNDNAIVYIASVNNKNVMVISSKNPELLKEGVNLLVDKSRILQENGVYAFANKEGSTLRNNDDNNSVESDRFTLADINKGGMLITGPFHQQRSIYLPLPTDFVLSEVGKIRLNFRYSENLDFDRSLVTVYWGDIPISSKKLSKEKSNADYLEVVMPEDLIGAKGTQVKISFDLEIKDLVCSLRQDQMPWAYVLDNSYFIIPTSRNSGYNFDIIPSPLQVANKFDNMLLIVSDNPKPTEINTLAQIISLYSTKVKAYGNMRVIRASEFSEQYHNYNIVTAGTFEQPFIAKIRDSLYFKYNDLTETLESNRQMVLSEKNKKESGVLQIQNSPYDNGCAVITAYAPNFTGLENTYNFLREFKNRQFIGKDCVLIDGKLNPTSMLFSTNQNTSNQPKVEEFIASNKDTIWFTIAASSVMLFLLLAVILILVRIRMSTSNNKRIDDENKE